MKSREGLREHSLQIDDIEPSIELEADLLQMGDLLETKFAMQRNARGLIGIDAGDDRSMSGLLCPLDGICQ